MAIKCKKTKVKQYELLIKTIYLRFKEYFHIEYETFYCFDPQFMLKMRESGVTGVVDV